jgi:hypothetical protein
MLYLKHNMSSDQTFSQMEQLKPEQEELRYINNRIEKEYCNETAMELTDEQLLDTYKKSPSVKKAISKLNNVLSTNNVNEEKKHKILEEYVLELIPPGTKGVIRGNKFNKIIENFINSLNFDKDVFDICFEKKCEQHMTNEIPDWYILEKETGKTIIGMNQLDLWGGGQQINRGSKYIINNQNNNENSKLLCVVCNKIQHKRNTNKTYNLFKVGFENNTLCYMNNLQNIICSFFNLK